MSISTVILDETTTTATQSESACDRALKAYVGKSEKSILALSLARIVDVYPFVYTVISCSARADSLSAQETLDQVEKILCLMIDLRQHGTDDWSELTDKLKELFESLSTDSPEIVPILEYAIGRTLLFCNIFREPRYLEPAFQYLHEKHLRSLEHHGRGEKYFGELLASWCAHSSSSLLDNSIESYLSTICTDEVEAFRNAIGEVWIQARRDDEESDWGAALRFIKPLRIASNYVGISDSVREFIFEKLDDVDDYSAAIDLLDELNESNEAERIALECVEKFGKYASDEISIFLIDRKVKKGDWEGAANDHLQMLINAPSGWMLREYLDFIDEHSQQLPKDVWKARAMDEIKKEVEKGDDDRKSELNSLLIDVALQSEETENALAYLTDGCNLSTLLRVLRKTDVRSHSYQQLFSPVSKLVEKEFAQGASANLETALELLLILYRAQNSSAEKLAFKTYLKSLKERFNLKGRPMSILRRVGL